MAKLNKNVKEANARLLVIGAGPGGYPAALRAADLGFDVTLVDARSKLGGVCLQEGCIPSKALLHMGRLISETQEAADWGVVFDKPKIDIDRLRSRLGDVIQKLSGGVGSLLKNRKVEVIQGQASFADEKTVEVTGADGKSKQLKFDYAIIATGSSPVNLPGIEKDRSAVWDSTDALALPEIPQSLLIIGGGYIGLEMGTVYSALGSQVTLVEEQQQLLPGVDAELVKPLEDRLCGEGPGAFKDILLGARVAEMEPYKYGMSVKIDSHDGESLSRRFNRVLVAIGRRPNIEPLSLASAKIDVDDQGFIATDEQGRTSRENIFAVGDVAGQPMLAHKATRQGRVAAEAAAGMAVAFDPAAIPAVVFTDPEIAWTGLTESEARERGLRIEVARFPWAASGRTVAIGRTEGLTKIIVDAHEKRILGFGIVGVGASELIAEGTLGVEMGAVLDDLGETIHPHPTMSETLAEVAHLVEGVSTHYTPRD